MALRGAIDRLMERPWAYRLWQAPFAERKFSPVLPHLETTPPRRVLDVGCGPGTNAARFRNVEYIGVDINDRYLELARARHRGHFVQADIATADLSHLGRFDTIVVNSFLHHLPDQAVDDVLAGIGRMLESTGRVHILELVRPERPALARMMADLDRGRYARSLDAWLRQFQRHLEPIIVEPYMLGRWLWSMLYFQGRTRP